MLKKIKGMSEKEMFAMSSSKMYPSLYMCESDMPEVNSMKVGDEFVMEVKVKVTSKDEYADGRDTNVRLEVMEYEMEETDNDSDPSTPRQSTSDGFMPKV